VVEKKGPAVCDQHRTLKAEIKTTTAHSSANAFQSQILNFQTSHIARRFGLAPSLAAILAELAFSNGRAA
jgi:hypothetical protein